MKNLEQVLESMKEPMIRTLREWVRVPSLKSEAKPGAPFGEELRRMLDHVLSSCSALGLRSKTMTVIPGRADGRGSGEDSDPGARGRGAGR